MTETISETIKAAQRSDAYASVMRQVEQYPENICHEAPIIACRGWIKRHTDLDFPAYSAFFTLRNDGCRVWQVGGYKGVPKAGERFVLRIHWQHGVQAAYDQVLALLYADGKTESAALRNLACVERAMRVR